MDQVAHDDIWNVVDGARHVPDDGVDGVSTGDGRQGLAPSRPARAEHVAGEHVAFYMRPRKSYGRLRKASPL